MILDLRQQLCSPEILPVLFGFLKSCISNYLDEPNNLPPGHSIIIQVSNSDQFLDAVTIQLRGQNFCFLCAIEIHKINQ